jgi:AcrR family transcriptional regulator
VADFLLKTKLTEKQREILDREGLILQAARELLAEGGYLGLTMDRIAERIGTSKPTVYHHFSSKEEVIMGVAIEDAIERTNMFKRASELSEIPREQLAAIGQVAEIMLPVHLETELILFTNSIRDKTSTELQVTLLEQESNGMQLLTGIIQAAVRRGDVVLPPGLRPEALLYVLWSMHIGGYTLQNVNVPLDRLEKLRFEGLQESLRWGAVVLLDGLGWRPLSSELDYGAVRSRVRKEAFAESYLRKRYRVPS